MTWQPVDLDAPNVEYAAYLASLGNPDHHVMLGTDWWGCLCGWACTPNPLVPAADLTPCNATAVEVDYEYRHIEDVGPTMADLHEFLWCEGAFG